MTVLKEVDCKASGDYKPSPNAEFTPYFRKWRLPGEYVAHGVGINWGCKTLAQIEHISKGFQDYEDDPPLMRFHADTDLEYS